MYTFRYLCYLRLLIDIWVICLSGLNSSTGWRNIQRKTCVKHYFFFSSSKKQKNKKASLLQFVLVRLDDEIYIQNKMRENICYFVYIAAWKVKICYCSLHDRRLAHGCIKFSHVVQYWDHLVSMPLHRLTQLYIIHSPDLCYNIKVIPPRRYIQTRCRFTSGTHLVAGAWK